MEYKVTSPFWSADLCKHRWQDEITIAYDSSDPAVSMVVGTGKGTGMRYYLIALGMLLVAGTIGYGFWRVDEVGRLAKKYGSVRPQDPKRAEYLAMELVAETNLQSVVPRWRFMQDDR